MTITTGFTALDNLLGGGFKPGELITVSGLPAIGKTSWVFQLIHNVCSREEGKNIILIPLEMDQKEAFKRLIALAGDVSMSSVIGGPLTKEQVATLKEAASKVQHWPIWVNAYSYRIEDVVKQARKLHAKNPVSLLIIDYLKLMYANRESEVEHAHTVEHSSIIVKELKSLAQELQIPILIVSAVTRDIVEDETVTPTLSSLRRSGLLVFESDVVIFLHHLPEYPAMSDGFQMNMHVIARRKNIETDVPIFFEPRLVKFTDGLSVSF